MKTVWWPVTLVALVLAGTGLARATATQLYQFDGATQGETAGFAVATGDVNHDGHRDIIIGAPLRGNPATNSSNAVSVYDGATGAQLARIGPGTNGSEFGRAVAAADVDGDGADDVIIGAPEQVDADGHTVGVVYVYAIRSGRVDLLAQFVGTTDEAGQGSEL